MKIKSIDGFSEIGTSHIECQDAILLYKEGNVAIGIISDGCSSSHEICKQTDFGAKILTYCALKKAKKLILNDNFWNKKFENPSEIGIQIAKEVKVIAKNLELSPLSLDATLLMFITNGEYLHMFMCGDGAFSYHSFGENASTLYRVEFSESAPFYPNYFNDFFKLNNYKEFEQTLDIDRYNIDDSDIRVHHLEPLNKFDSKTYNHTYWHFNLKETPFSSFVVYSDGIFTQSFANINSDIKCQTINISDFETQFNDNNGEFIKKRFINENKEREPSESKWKHYDDLSVVGVSFGY